MLKARNSFKSTYWEVPISKQTLKWKRDVSSINTEFRTKLNITAFTGPYLSLYLLNLIHPSFHRILLSVYCTLELKTLSTLFLFNFFLTPFFFFIFLHFLTIQTPSHSFNSPKSPCGLSHWSSGNSQLTFIGSLFILPTFSDFPWLSHHPHTGKCQNVAPEASYNCNSSRGCLVFRPKKRNKKKLYGLIFLHFLMIQAREDI